MACLIALSATSRVHAQSEIYPRHFDLHEVELTDGPMKTAMDKNIDMLLQYDTDRLLTPFVRQAGLSATTDATSPYYQWESRHPNFRNWGDPSFDLSGHVGGHYLSALALAFAATHDTALQTQLKSRLDYMLQVLSDCQRQFDSDTGGLYGFIGGQPLNDEWRALFRGDIQPFKNRGGWVPFYCEHKILAGLRDAYLYGVSSVAKELLRKLCDWSVNVVARLSEADMQRVLDTEHGGMNESMLDAYQLFGDTKYLEAARKYTHRTMLDGMQTLNATFLDGRHANTQVPKYIGMERIGEISSADRNYIVAAQNFWTDVAHHRTVCIGGNSVNEHFLSVANSNRYIDQLDGPESCNSNNMLKLSEMLSDYTADAAYADFYENTMWNHILTTQDPETGGYVYFTTLRPQGYRIYSQVNQGMWCCVGTGMENHSKYGHFIYTHDGANTLYVNLFTASKLRSRHFALTQETRFPFIDPTASNIPTPYTTTTQITVEKAGRYKIAVRHPAWAGAQYAVMVNGQAVQQPVVQGTASYVTIDRQWAVGDRITVWLPMELRYEECPNYTDYIAFKFGPILLGAATTAATQAEASATGLSYEQLQNVYAGEGRMDHAPGSRGTSRTLNSAPMLIGNRSDVLGRISPLPGGQLRFTIDASRPDVSTYSWHTLTLQPFYQIHHRRYMCYWYQQTPEGYANSTMAQSEAALEALNRRTLDFVAPGEQQSEAGHEYNYSSNSTTGEYNTEHYRDAQAGGHIQYTLYNNSGIEENLSIMLRFTLADRGRQATLTVDGEKIADITIPGRVKNSDDLRFFNAEYPIPASLARGKTHFVVRLTATGNTPTPGLYYVRLLKDYQDQAYQFRAKEWTTGDEGRVRAAYVKADTVQNVLHVTNASGANNVCLMLRHEVCDYTIDKGQKYLVVRGTNLSTSPATSSYLWWLNGSNHGTQVTPAQQRNISVAGTQQQVIAWDMTTSGLYENFEGQHPNVTLGQTIFGLTARTGGKADILDVNFVASINDYINTTSGIASPLEAMPDAAVFYSVSGMRVSTPAKGIYLTNGRKVVY